MMTGLLSLVLVAVSVGRLVTAQCTLTCAAGQTCFATSTAAMDCLESIPFNQAWADATVDVISQSLENFGFDALYHNTGPPYNIKLDVQQELTNTQTMADGGQFTNDLEFQEHMQALIQTTVDAHTRYQKPACYNAIFVQPFAFDFRVPVTAGASNEPVVYLMENLYTDSYSTVYGTPDAKAVIGKQVLLLNGLEVTTAIATWGDTHETRSNNPGIRFNAALRSYLYRSAISCNILPLEDLVVTLADGSEYTFQWMASYANGLADLAFCAVPALQSTPAGPMDRGAMHDEDELIESSQPLVHSVLHDDRPDRTVIVPTTSPIPVTCFVQTVTSDDATTAGVSKVLVMKVSSFSPDGFYLDAWEGFLDNAKQCLSADFDTIIVDVMQNGGGYVCLGLRLLELLVEDYANDHTKVQMNYDLPHSALMDKYIEVVNAPDPYPNPQDVEQILDRSTQAAFPDGQAYYYPGRNVTQGGVVSWRTNFFSLNCTQAEAMPINWQPPRYMSPDRLIIMTDGTCGSTCASFTKIPQEAAKATFVGIGGIWDQGMDVSSFAGGFVCNPSYLQNIATWSGITFPAFLTNQRWQFGWAAWYSAKLPTRPVQFTVQDPDYRQAFWGFPHPSIDATVTTDMVSGLYDSVISSSVTRLAAAVPPEDSCDDDDNKVNLLPLIILGVLLVITLAALVYVYFFMVVAKRYVSVSREEVGGPLADDLIVSGHSTKV